MASKTVARSAKPPESKELDPDRNPWEKQRWETGPAWEGFVMYRDLGFGRSLSLAAEAILELAPKGRRSTTKVESLRRQLATWSSLNLWVQRSDAYDLDFDRRQTEKAENRIVQQNRRYEGGAAALSARILERARLKPGEERDGVVGFNTNEMDFEGAVRALKTLQGIEKLATGQHTDFLKGVMIPSPDVAARMLEDVIQIAMGLFDDSRRAIFAQRVSMYIESGGKTL